MKPELLPVPTGVPFSHPPPQDLDPEELRALDAREKLVERIGFVMGAIWRRRWLVVGVFVVGTLATLLFLRRMPRTYHVETKILAQKQEALPALVRPQAQEEAPTKAAPEFVHRRDNLLTLIKETNLYAGVAPESAKPQKKKSLREWLRLPPLGVLNPEMPSQDALSGLVARLDHSIKVTTDENTVTIGVDWPDAQQAYQLVKAALENFLEARHLQEVNSLDEVISLLEGRASRLRDELQFAEGTLHKEVPPETDSDPSSASRLPRLRTQPPDQEAVQLKVMIEAKQRAIRDVEDFRHRRLAELQAQLDEKRGMYSDAYPSVVNLRQDIAALSKESPQVAALKEDLHRLEADYSRHVGKWPGTNEGASASTSGALRRTRIRSLDDPDTVERIKDARYRYERMLDRIGEAELELDTARSGFKHRYSIIYPAELPSRPSKPNVSMVLGTGMAFSFFMAVFLAVLVDYRAGKLVEPWQVKRVLELPLIAVVPK